MKPNVSVQFAPVDVDSVDDPRARFPYPADTDPLTSVATNDRELLALHDGDPMAELIAVFPEIVIVDGDVDTDVTPDAVVVCRVWS